MARGAWKRGDFATAARNWATGYTASGPALIAGVKAPKRSPTQAAVGAKDRMVSGFNASVSDGTWERNITRSGDQGWMAGMTLFANSGLGTKATKGTPHYQAFAQAYGPAVVQQAQALPPRGSFEQNQQRSAQLNTWQHSQKGKFKGAWRGGA